MGLRSQLFKFLLASGRLEIRFLIKHRYVTKIPMGFWGFGARSGPLHVDSVFAAFFWFKGPDFDECFVCLGTWAPFSASFFVLGALVLINVSMFLTSGLLFSVSCLLSGAWF